MITFSDAGIWINTTKAILQDFSFNDFSDCFLQTIVLTVKSRLFERESTCVARMRVQAENLPKKCALAIPSCVLSCFGTDGSRSPIASWNSTVSPRNSAPLALE